MSIKIKIKSLLPGNRIETFLKKSTEGSAGYDMYSKNLNLITLQPGEVKLIKMGFVMEIPEGYEAQIRSRSGLSLRDGIIVLNAPGTIDSDYRGEVGVILCNTSDRAFTFCYNTRIAQVVFKKVEEIEFEYADNLSETKRGGSGYGSTGIGE